MGRLKIQLHRAPRTAHSAHGEKTIRISVSSACSAVKAFPGDPKLGSGDLLSYIRIIGIHQNLIKKRQHDFDQASLEVVAMTAVKPVYLVLNTCF